MATIHPNRRIERAGVNALRTLLDADGHLVQELADGTDHGEDCFVMLARGGERTGYAFMAQVKAGKKYKRARGYAINVGRHGRDWRFSKLPVIAVVYDVDERRLFWINLTQQLGLAQAEPSWVAIPRENELHAGSIGAFCAHIEEFIDSAKVRKPSAPPLPRTPKRLAFRTPQELWQHTTGAPQTRQPLVASGHVLVRNGHRLRVLDAVSGAACWSKTTAFDRANPAGDDAVFVSAGGGRLRALTLREGRQRWERPLRVRDDLMTYGSQTLYAPTGHGDVFALNSRSGDIVWTASGRAGPLAAPIVVGAGQVFTLRTKSGSEERATRVTALSVEDGTESWSYQADAPLTAGWVLDGGVLYAVERPDSGSSVIMALRAQSGERLWSVLLPEPVRSAPVVSGEFVYVTGGHGGVFQLSGESGAQWCRFPADASPAASPVVADGSVVVSQGRALAAYDTADGGLRWRRRLPGLAVGQPFVVGPAVYIAHRAGLAAHGVASSGRRLWSSEVTWDTQAQGEPVVVDGVLYVTDRRGIVRAFGTADHGS
ncbi:outer membrane protein assembly factor BamB family protein [Streptomyces halstedii]|uniref:outer membrane protein assembly factor BamB family protein n=1 Tax=Streptomyces halstedii TaxID=1944 RepID=UPI003829F1A5